nr:hypothetical protein CFP56_30250 [Quercus suber]
MINKLRPNSDPSFLNKFVAFDNELIQDSLLQCHLRLCQVYYRHGMIRMLDVNTICKEGDIGLMVAITLNIRFKTSSTRTSGVRMLVSSVVWKEGMHIIAARPLTQYQRQ